MPNIAQKPLEARVLAQSAYDALQGLIVSGELEPGSRIALDDLASNWGISRTPIREAIARLALVDLVVVSRNAKTEVALWTPNDMFERVQMLGALTAAALDRFPAGSSAGATPDPDDPASDVRGFVAACLALLEHSPCRLSHSLAATQLAPILLDFYREPNTARFGVELTEGAPDRRRILHELVDGIETESAPYARACIEEYLRALAQAHLTQNA
jgi:hypothetical protein